MSDPTDTWEWFTASLPSGKTEGYIEVACSDGDSWVGFGGASDGSTTEQVIAVGDSGGEEWELRSGFTMPTGNYVYACAYGDGEWVGVGGKPTATMNTLVVSTTNPYGTWDVNTHAFGYIATGVAYGDGTWAMILENGKVYTATDPAGTWTLAHDIGVATTGTYQQIAYDSGTWVLAYQAGASPYYVHVKSATDPNGTWTSRGSFDGGGPAIGVGNTPDGWFVRCETKMGSKDDLADASWTVTTGLPAAGNLGPGLAYGDGYYVVCSSAVSSLGVKIATSLTGPYTDVASTEVGGGGMFLFGGPYYNGQDWVIVGDRGYDNEPGVLAPPSGGGTGWGVVL